MDEHWSYKNFNMVVKRLRLALIRKWWRHTEVS